MAFLRFMVFGLIALTIIYFSLSLFARSLRKEKLEEEFDAEYPDGGAPGARDDYIAQGLETYRASLRPKLIGLVYGMPTVVIGVIIYTINAN